MVVTTAVRVTPELWERAGIVAGRCGVPRVRRDGPVPEGLVYVVAREAEWVTDGSSRLGVDAGLLHAKLAPGHPLIRAVGPAARVLDGTLGLAGDALHLAGALRAEVVAAERSPAVFCLAEAGLARLGGGRWAEIARRVHLVPGDAGDVARAHGPFDVAFLAPMFEEPARAAPGYALFRELAVHRPLDVALLEAVRSAATTVVVRVPKGGGPPEPSGWTSIPGKAVDYWRWTAGAGPAIVGAEVPCVPS